MSSAAVVTETAEATHVPPSESSTPAASGANASEGVKRKAAEESPEAPEASSKRPKEDDSTETAPAETTDGEAEVKQVVAPAGDKPVASATSTASTSAFGKISSLGQAVFGKPSSSTLPAFGKASSVGSAWTKTKLGSGSSTGFGSTSKGFGSFGSGVSGFGARKKSAEEAETASAGTGDKAKDGATKPAFGSTGASLSVFGAKSSDADKGESKALLFSVSSGKAATEQPKAALVQLKGATEATGEEADKHALKFRARLYCSVQNGDKRAWQEQGTGQLTINDKMVDGKRVRSRIVMRQDSNRLVLNAQIWAGMNPEKVTARAVRVTATNHAKAALTGFKAGDKEGAPTNEVFLIKVGPKEIDQLVTCIKLRVDSSKESGASS